MNIFSVHSPHLFVLGIFFLFSECQQSLTAKNLLLFIPNFYCFSLVFKVMKLEGGRLFFSPIDIYLSCVCLRTDLEGGSLEHFVDAVHLNAEDVCCVRKKETKCFL